MHYQLAVCWYGTSMCTASAHNLAFILFTFFLLLNFAYHCCLHCPPLNCVHSWCTDCEMFRRFSRWCNLTAASIRHKVCICHLNDQVVIYISATLCITLTKRVWDVRFGLEPLNTLVESWWWTTWIVACVDCARQFWAAVGEQAPTADLRALSLDWQRIQQLDINTPSDATTTVQLEYSLMCSALSLIAMLVSLHRIWHCTIGFPDL